MKIDGRCHCGLISFEAEVDPADTSICHCTDCQSLSGTAFRVSVAAERKNFRFVAGEPTIYIKVAESGRRRIQAFCPKCGSPFYSTSPDDAEAPFNIRVGVVRQRNALVPTEQIWTRSRQPWLDDLTAIPLVEGE